MEVEESGRKLLNLGRFGCTVGETLAVCGCCLVSCTVADVLSCCFLVEPSFPVDDLLGPVLVVGNADEDVACSVVSTSGEAGGLLGDVESINVVSFLSLGSPAGIGLCFLVSPPTFDILPAAENSSEV